LTYPWWLCCEGAHTKPWIPYVSMCCETSIHFRFWYFDVVHFCGTMVLLMSGSRFGLWLERKVRTRVRPCLTGQ